MATRYLRDYARRDTRKPHAIRQFEIHVTLLVDAVVDGAGDRPRPLGAIPFTAIARADLDTVFSARLDAVQAALDAARQAAALRALRREVPKALPVTATSVQLGNRAGLSRRHPVMQVATPHLRFYDLRREFACRLLESRAELHDVRDFLEHANLTTTSRYLRSTALRLERALRLLEHAQARRGVRHSLSARGMFVPVPHRYHKVRVRRTTSITRSTRKPLRRWNLKW